MSVIKETRDDLVVKLKTLESGSDKQLQLAKTIQILSEADLADNRLEFDKVKEENRKLEKSSDLEFEKEKEETRKLEKSNDLAYSRADAELRKIDLAINAINLILNPPKLITTVLNNKCRVNRDIMGYEFETTGVVGSHTFNNAQKDKYD